MRNFTKEDFKWRSYEAWSTSVRITMNDTGVAVHLEALHDLYKFYRLGNPSKRNPHFQTIGHIDTVDSLPDLAWLEEDESCYLLYHKKHPKFGHHILEYAKIYNQNYFAFFDYKVLKYVFDALDNNEPLPHVPTYYAEIYDRYDYQNNTYEKWVAGDPKLQDMYADLKTETD